MTQDTAQQRAEALLLELRQIDKRHADEGIAFVTELLGPIIEFAQQARLDALAEAARVVKGEYYLGLPNIDSTRKTVEVNHVHRWMQAKLDRIADALDRLREGV